MKPTFLERLGCLVHPTGSKYICDPPVLDTDEDWAVYAPPNVNLVRELDFIYRRSSEGYPEGGHFSAWRAHLGWSGRSLPGITDGNENLIIFNDYQRYQRFVNATEEAKRLNLLDKNERVRLFKLFENDKYTIDLDEDDEDCI